LTDITGKPDDPAKSSTTNNMAHLKLSKKYLHTYTESEAMDTFYEKYPDKPGPLPNWH
jgi:hypothetical protein